MRDKPFIFKDCAVNRPKENPLRSKTTTVPSANPPIEATGQKGNLLICNISQNGTGIVHNIHVVNTDAKFCSVKTHEKCLHEAERAKKNMYLEACLQQRQHFAPFVASVNVLLGVETMGTLKRIASFLATQ